MGHITDQYGPYYRPIWAILLTHPLPLPKGGEPKSGASHIVEMGIAQLQDFQLLVGLLHESLVLI